MGLINRIIRTKQIICIDSWQNLRCCCGQKLLWSLCWFLGGPRRVGFSPEQLFSSTSSLILLRLEETKRLFHHHHQYYQSIRQHHNPHGFRFAWALNLQEQEEHLWTNHPILFGHHSVLALIWFERYLHGSSQP